MCCFNSKKTEIWNSKRLYNWEFLKTFVKANMGTSWILDLVNELKFQQLEPLNMIKSPTVRLISLCQC